VKIGYRTIKTAIATPIAVFIAQMLNVSNVVAAGILTILCIQPSRKRSVETAWERFAACLLAILFSFVFFELFGYSVFSLGLLLFLFIPSTVYLKVDSGILTGTVITLNIFYSGMMNFPFIKEQLTLIIVGIGTGLAVNLYMPSLDNKLQDLQKELEADFKTILHEIARFLREENMDWQGAEITKVSKLLKEADEYVKRDKENHLWREVHLYEQYFAMRKRQFSLLKQMLPIVARIEERNESTMQLALFFSELSEAVHPGDTSVIYIQQLKDLHEALLKTPLPETEEQFQSRANLFQLLFLLESYLHVKSNYFQTTEKKKKKRRHGIFHSRLPF